MKRKFFLMMLPFIMACSDKSEDIKGENTPQEESGLDLGDHVIRTFTSPSLLTYHSCDQLSRALKKSSLEKMRVDLAIRAKNMPNYYDGAQNAVMPAPMGGDMAVPMAPPPPPVGDAIEKGGLTEGVDFSGTNNQEKGVDEADVVKIDGEYFYILNKSTLEILAIPSIGELVHRSTLRLKNPGSELIISDDMAYIFSHDSSKFVDNPLRLSLAPAMPDYPKDNVRVDIVDLSEDRAEPQIIESLYFQGELLAARKIGDKVHLATYLDAPMPGLDLHPDLDEGFHKVKGNRREALWAEAIKNTVKKNENVIENFDFLDLLPTKLTKEQSKFKRLSIEDRDCANTFGSEDGSATGFLSLITIDTSNTEQKVDIQRVRGNRPIVYASPNQFILASPEHSPWWFFHNETLKEQTTIHRFDIHEGGMASYRDSIRIPGTLHNSFSLSEYEGYLRAATTTRGTRPWMPTENSPAIPDENHLFILGDDEGSLSIVSSIEGIAPGEKIWSARFTKDKGFLVTFKQVDPLFTLDLSDPKNPKIAGALKIPGVSTYLQDIGNDHLLAVGYGGDEDGLDFQTTISLFDTSDFSSPRLFDTLSFSALDEIDGSWSRVSSEANQNHLAINYFAPVAMTAIPVNTHRYVSNPLDPMGGGEFEYISKLSLVNTAPGEQLAFHGHVDHSEFYNQGFQPSYRGSQIQRSYFVGDFIYAISSAAVTVTRLSDMITTGSYELP
jgi:hypothetical protein